MSWRGYAHTPPLFPLLQCLLPPPTVRKSGPWGPHAALLGDKERARNGRGPVAFVEAPASLTHNHHRVVSLVFSPLAEIACVA